MRPSLLAIALLACAGLSPAQAFDQRMVGAWSQSASDCAALFTRSGGKISFKQPIDEFKTAFIVTPNSVVSPTAKCTIRKTTTQKDMSTLAMTCSNSIGFYDRQAQIKVENNILTYGFPGESTLDVRFEKCPM